MIVKGKQFSHFTPIAERGIDEEGFAYDSR